MNHFIKLFANSSLATTLGWLLSHPDEEFYQTAIAKHTQCALIQVQRALKVLAEIGLVTAKKQGRMVFYQTVKSHPVFSELKQIFFKMITTGESLKQTLITVSDKVDFAFIFGSIASGHESIDSDIDLFVIGDLTLLELSKILGPLARKLHRELNPVLFTLDEFLQGLTSKDHFIREVAAGEKIWLIGSETEFKNLA
jgi:predicted nucleotidyltransferase